MKPGSKLDHSIAFVLIFLVVLIENHRENAALRASRRAARVASARRRR